MTKLKKLLQHANTNLLIYFIMTVIAHELNRDCVLYTILREDRSLRNLYKISENLRSREILEIFLMQPQY